ncbi:nitrogen regulation protein NR(II) [Candidatus Omnitrophota bacterium]
MQALHEKTLPINNISPFQTISHGLIHDFNNILTLLEGNITLAQMSIDKHERVSEILLNAEHACEQAKDLINQMSFLCSYNALNKKEISLTRIIQKSARLISKDQDTICKIDVPEDLWLISANESQIFQVFFNLMLNAVQAMDKKRVLTITGSNTYINKKNKLKMVADDYVVISITDNGCGIPPEEIDRIFEPYYTTKQNGKGLGLAITYLIIQEHKGYITVNSQEGKNTTFSIYLPAYFNENKQ